MLQVFLSRIFGNSYPLKAFDAVNYVKSASQDGNLANQRFRFYRMRSSGIFHKIPKNKQELYWLVLVYIRSTMLLYGIHRITKTLIYTTTTTTKKKKQRRKKMKTFVAIGLIFLAKTAFATSKFLKFCQQADLRKSRSRNDVIARLLRLCCWCERSGDRIPGRFDWTQCRQRLSTAATTTLHRGDVSLLPRR